MVTRLIWTLRRWFGLDRKYRMEVARRIEQVCLQIPDGEYSWTSKPE